MASSASEALEPSGSAMMAVTSQLQQARQWEADDPCSICLGEISNTAYIDGCFHTFCFSCILQWADRRAACPLCQQPFSHILHMVRADDDYQEHVVNSSACQQETTTMEQVRNHPETAPTNNEPASGERERIGRHPEAQGDTAPEHSNASASQQP